MPDAKVEIVGLRGIPDVMGGVEVHCEELIPRIAKLAPDLDIEVVARRAYVGSGVRGFEGVEIIPLFAPRRQGLEALVSTFLGVLRGRRRGARLIHIHGIGPALLSPLARLLGMRVIVTHHSLNYHHQKWGFAARTMLKLGEFCTARFANHVIVVAPWLRDHLRRTFPTAHQAISYIPNGRATFPNSSEGGLVLKELGLTPGKYILAVGRLVPEKGFDALIEAKRASSSTLPLVICGGADHAGHYSTALQAKASSDCVFAGVRSRTELKTLYENAALFVLSSEHEGFPLAALDAGSLGCPLLLSDIEPTRDLGLPPHHYFPTRNVQALARKLDEDPASFAVDRALFEQYDWDDVACRTLAVYQAVLDNEPAS